MPRPQKQGIDYAGWSVNIFDGDTKIDKLLDAQGWIGFSVYFYLCQMAYKFDGYFYRWAYDDSASTARRMGGGIGSGTVEETVRYCLQIGLFDQRLFDKWSILTSRGIQKRFLAAIRGRRVKTVIPEYWLLKNEESKGLDKCAENESLQPTNPGLQYENPGLQHTNTPKVKESKVKEEDICAHNPDVAIVFSAYGEKIMKPSGTPMTERIRDELLAFLGMMGPDCCIRAMDEAIEAGAINWRYIRGVLAKKRKQGVRHIEDWDAVEAGRKESSDEDDWFS